jgi:hypothetical protein
MWTVVACAGRLAPAFVPRAGSRYDAAPMDRLGDRQRAECASLGLANDDILRLSLDAMRSVAN